MVFKQSKNPEANKNSINSAVARVSGAVRVASVTVDETMKIKDEALDYIEASRTKSNSKTGNFAVKKIETDVKKVLEKK